MEHIESQIKHVLDTAEVKLQKVSDEVSHTIHIIAEKSRLFCLLEDMIKTLEDFSQMHKATLKHYIESELRTQKQYVKTSDSRDIFGGGVKNLFHNSEIGNSPDQYVPIYFIEVFLIPLMSILKDIQADLSNEERNDVKGKIQSFFEIFTYAKIGKDGTYRIHPGFFNPKNSFHFIKKNTTMYLRLFSANTRDFEDSLDGTWEDLRLL